MFNKKNLPPQKLTCPSIQKESGLPTIFFKGKLRVFEGVSFTATVRFTTVTLKAWSATKNSRAAQPTSSARS